MASDDASDDTVENDKKKTQTMTLTRRRALSFAGAGLVASIGSAMPAAAISASAVVYNAGDGYVAENDGSVVYRGGDIIAAIQSAVDSLTPGRTSKEKVRVDASGYTGPAGNIRAVDLPSYTILDVPGSIDVNDSGEPLVIPVRAQNAESIEIPRLNVTGNPRYGMWIQSCTDVTIGSVHMDLTAGLAVRIDANQGSRTRNVSLDYANITGSSAHAVETYSVDHIDIGTVETVDTGGCGLLLNNTSDATVEYVNAVRADQGGGYAGFRCANDCGPNITVNRVDAVDCGRGVFTVSNSYGITIRNVYLEGCGSGVLFQDTRNTTMDGGTITNNSGEGVRIDSRTSDRYPYTRNVTVENLQITNNDYGVLETGPDTESNAILNNNLCNNATANIVTYAANTVVRGNTICNP